MKNRKRSGILIIIVFCCSFATEEAWVIDPRSKLSIHGTTNVNAFTCELNSYTGRDTLWYFKNFAAHRLQFTDNRMTIPVRSFNCGSSQMSKDFFAALKADQYPYLIIRFVSLESTTLENNSTIEGAVDITAAGVTTRCNIIFLVKVDHENVTLSGDHPVTFTNFKLRAPTKLNGLIRVRDALQVHLHLFMKAV